ncbi:MAG: DinB family protein [Chloroflexota bacterium]|nr:DinB family protein [Chloroflexota bacterium]
MKLDMEAVFTGRASYADIIRDVKPSDLHAVTGELFDEIESIIAEATDVQVTFAPHDPVAREPGEQGWPISHAIAHLTASMESAAVGAAMMARGVSPKERLSYETPWETLQQADQVRARLKESRRMCEAFLNAWPDQPHLDVMATPIPPLGPMNAIGVYMLGIGHGQSHLPQLHEIMRQSSAA